VATALYQATTPQAVYSLPSPADPDYSRFVEDGQVTRGLRSALVGHSAGTAADEYWQARAAGDMPRAQASQLRAQQLAQEAEQVAPRVRSLRDIHGWGDGADWFAGTVGSLPVSAVPAMGGGLAGGVLGGLVAGPAGAAIGSHLGASGGMYPQLRDAARLQQLQAEQQGAPALDPQRVLTNTSNQGLTQSLIEGTVPGLASGSLVRGTAANVLRQPVASAAKRIGRDVLLDTGAAGVSEGVAMGYETGRDAQRDTTDDGWRLADAMAGEAAGGVAYGAMGHAGDVGHQLLGGGAAAVGDAASYAARAGKRGAIAAGGAAKQAWDARPQSWDEAAVMVGEGAANLHNQAEDMVTRWAQKGRDADVDVLLTPQKGMDEAGLRADDAAKHQAAANFIAKTQANPGAVPDYVHAAVQQYMQGSKTMDSWRPVADAVNDMHRSEDILSGANDLLSDKLAPVAEALGKGAADLMNAKDDALTAYNGKREADGRQNAMTPAMGRKIANERDDFSPILEESLAPFTGLKTPEALENAMPTLGHAMRNWVANGFSMKKGGEPVVPKSLLNMFTDPAAAVVATTQMMHKQGLIDDDALQTRARVLEQIKVLQDTQKDTWAIVESNLLPTARRAYSTPSLRTLAEKLQGDMRADKIDSAEARQLFGPRARLVLDALRNVDEKARRKDGSFEFTTGEQRTNAQVDEFGDMAGNPAPNVIPGMDAEGMEQITSSHLDPDAGAPTVKYHHYKEGSVDKTTGEIKLPEPFRVGGRVKNNDKNGLAVPDTFHDTVSKQRMAELHGTSAVEATQQGYMDYLREKHGNDAEGLMGDAQKIIESKYDELLQLQNKTGREVTTEDGSKHVQHDDLGKVLNDNYYVLREEAQREKGEATNVTANEFGREGANGQIIGNKWAEKVGKDGEFGTTAHGRIWLERMGSDGKPREFATSASRIIDRMFKARKAEGRVDESSGLAGQKTALMQGLASLLAAAHPETEAGKYGQSTSGKSGTGAPVLSGRVGYKEAPGDQVRWLKAGEDFPASLRMYSGDKTYGDAKAAVKGAANQKILTAGKALLKSFSTRLANMAPDAKGRSYVIEDIEDLSAALEAGATKAVDAILRKSEKYELGREDDAEIGADTYETKPVTRTDVIARDNQGNKFGSKKLALASAKGSDRVVKRAGAWVVERDVADTRREHTGLPTEIGEMGKATSIRSRHEDGESDGERYYDELGQALHPFDSRATPSADKEQRAQRTAFVIDALAKGVPSFVAMARKLSPERREALLGHLQRLVESPKFAPHAARARVALIELGKMQGATKKSDAAKPASAPPSQKFADVAEKMNNYLKNPPADYNVKQVEAIRDWATKQEARLKAEAAKHEEGSDEYDRLDDLRFKATLLRAEALKALKNEAEVKAHHDETGGPRYNAQTPEGVNDDAKKHIGAHRGFVASVRRQGDEFRRVLEARGFNPANTPFEVFVDGTDFGPAKGSHWLVYRGSNGFTHAFSVAQELVPQLQRFLSRPEFQNETRALNAMSYFAIQHAMFDPVKKTFDTLGPMAGSPAHKLHANSIEDTGLKLPSGESLLRVLGTTPQQMIRFFGMTAAFHEAMGGMISDVTWERVSGARVKNTGMTREGSTKFNKQNPANKAFGTSTATPATPAEVEKFHADIMRRLGPGMKSAALEMLYGKNAKGKDIMLSGKWEKGAIYASVYARNLGQVGAHEAFHEFFDRMKSEPAAAEVMKLLDRAANAPYVVRQLERLLDGETEALKQIKQGAKNAAEERMAYMFQFWEAGLLNIGPETQNIFTKLAAFFRKVAGLLNDDERVDLLLRNFDEGKMQTADAAARVLANSVTARQKMYEGVNNAFKPMMERAGRLVNTAETNLERTGNPVYKEVRRMFKRSVGEDGAQGFLDAKDHQMKLWGNRLATVFEGLHPKDLELAAPYLHTGETPKDPAVKQLVARLKGPNGLLPEMHKYLKQAGVERWEASPDGEGGEWVPMGKIDHGYFPRAYDTAMILGNVDGFVADLVKFNPDELGAIAAAQNATLAKSVGKDFTPVTSEDVAKAIANRLINAFGQTEIEESGSSIGFSPFMQAINRRQMHWIHPEMLKKYGDKDVSRILTGYIAQGVKRAEYVRKFGNGGEVLKDKLEKAHDMQLAKLVENKFGVTDLYNKAKMAKPIDGKGSMPERMWQTVTFSQPDADKAAFDALTVKALKMAQGAAKDVMAMEGTLGYNISPKNRQFQNSVLVYENMRLLSMSLFSQFIDPLNLLVRGATVGDAWNAYKRGLREVVASIKDDPIKDLDAKIADQVGTTDANHFLAAFGQLHGSQYLGAKFRKINDVMFKYNGMEGFNRGMQVAATRAAINFIKRHVQTPNERSAAYLKELNLTAKDVKVGADGELDYTDPRIQQALHQWVNGSVLRPNAAQRPAWASDPHYMVFWHMKQFAYTFHDVVLKRALHDYKKFGDMGPAGMLALTYTPVMIASDALKSVLLTGDEPVWMKGGLDSELEHGAMRAGLLGKFQPMADTMAPHHTVLSLGGPAIEQITEMFTDAPAETAVNALPGANVWNTMKGNSLADGHADS